jgi:choline-sulfatase
MPDFAFVLRLTVLILLSGAACDSRTSPVPVTADPLPDTTAPEVRRFRDYNLVFISFDALQAAHVGHLGYERDVTPTLDAMARRGFSFTHAMSVASWTVPSSMSWFTGVYPSEHRMTNKFAVWNRQVQKPANLRELSPDLITLADILRLNGYANGGFTGNAGVSGGFGFEQGFDVYYHEKNRFGSFDDSIPRALEWLKQNREKKLFLFLHGYDAHGQNTPADGFDYRFVDPGYDKRFLGSAQEQELLREEGLDRGFVTLREADVRFWRAIYDEKIRRADEKLRNFLTEYDRLGLTDRTLFVITSDHGTEFHEHRRFDHGFTLYNEQIHVPLIIALPGQTTAGKVHPRISSIDLMPTLLDLLAVPLPDKAKQQLRGQSLIPVMQGKPVRRDLFCETNYRDYTFKRAIITPDHRKFIFTLESRTRELYNLANDPGETNNLIREEPKLARELEERLFDHFASIGHDLSGRNWETGLNPVYNSQAKGLNK